MTCSSAQLFGESHGGRYLVTSWAKTFRKCARRNLLIPPRLSQVSRRPGAAHRMAHRGFSSFAAQRCADCINSLWANPRQRKSVK